MSKSTLSLWLRYMPLSKKQIRSLSWDNERRIERFRKTMQKKRQMRLDKVYEMEKKYWLPLSKREMLLAGLFLYWGEGQKAGTSTVSVSNTNPAMLKFVLKWLIDGLGVDEHKIGIKLHLYQDMDEIKMISYWSKQLGVKRQQFKKSYIKKSSLSSLTYKGFGYGTCNLIVESVPLKEQIMMGIKVFSDKLIGECYN